MLIKEGFLRINPFRIPSFCTCLETEANALIGSWLLLAILIGFVTYYHFILAKLPF